MECNGIRLFGKKISLPETAAAGTAREEHSECEYGGSDHDLTMEKKACLEGERVDIEDTDKDELKEKNSEAKPEDRSSPKSMEESDGTTNSETEGEKTLKKPDKIIPCPRCNSMDTKFCYYNNYNVSQPRHFCKSCQRYWTAGGTMRTMPVGAGRRKTKTFDGVRGLPSKVLSFASDSPHVGQENGDDCSSGSTVTTSNSVAEDKNGFHSQVHCIPGVSWPYNPWNSAIPIPFPAFCPPMPFYPSPYWNYIPWVSPSMNQNAQFHSDPNSMMLGKHSRDEKSINPNGYHQEEPKKHKNTVLIPKTLRIDDPDEAAKSSIWATLGIKNETSSRGGVFKAFEAKGEENKKCAEATPAAVLYANPAALSRSLCFQERA